MDWFKKHVDTVVVLTAMFSSFIWMDGKFTDMNDKFSSIEKDMAIVKTVLIMKGIMPSDIAKSKE